MTIAEIVYFLITLCGVCGELDTVHDASLNLCSHNGYLPKTYNISNIRKCGCGNNCIRTCCKAGYYFSYNKCDFGEDITSMTVPVHNKEKYVKEVNQGFSVGFLTCAYFKLNKSDPGDASYIQEDGKLWFPLEERFVNNDLYCIDGENTFLCFTQSAEQVGREINAIGMIISMPFLLATFLIYALIPERNLHEKALMCYVLFLLLAYIDLVVTRTYLPSPICAFVGFLNVFFLLGSFFWMNVICLDIWSTFSGLKGVIRNGKYSERKIFLSYLVYALTVPCLFVLMVYLIDLLGDQNAAYHPHVGEEKCALADGLPNLLYLYGPMTILIAINATLFIMTALKIRKVKKEISLLRHTNCHNHEYECNKENYNLYLKLMFVMGINWSMEVVAWAVDWQAGKSTPYEVWYITDFCNAIYGVFIFFLFVFKKKMWMRLQKRFASHMGSAETISTNAST